MIGKGSFGTVFKAELQGAEGFSRPVALKVLNMDGGDMGDMGARLRDEAHMLGMIRHRAVVQVESLVALDDRWTIVMEYIEGSDLGRLPNGMVPPGVALEVISEVASALHVAQTTEVNGKPLGLMHRDLKPSNILLTPTGSVKVVDFGGARADFEGRRAHTSNVTIGSPGYIAPERMLGNDSAAGDVYSLGVVLFELITGLRFGPTSGRHSVHTALVERMLGEAKLLPSLDAFIRTLVAHDPSARPTVREVESQARDLRGEVGGPWLRDWAEEYVQVPPLLETKHDFSNTVLFERPNRSANANATFNTSDEVFVDVLDTFMSVEPDEDPSSKHQLATRLNRLPPRAPRPAAPSILRRVLLLVVVAFVVVPLAFFLGLTLVLLGWSAAMFL